MTPDQLSEVARQLSAIGILLIAAVLLHRGTIVLGREMRAAEERAVKAERKAEEWEAFALRQLGISERAVGAAERVLPPRAEP